MKLITVKKRNEILHIKNKGKRFFCKYFTVIAAKCSHTKKPSEKKISENKLNSLKSLDSLTKLDRNNRLFQPFKPQSRIVFVVSKKNGCAVARNRIKRRLRVIARYNLLEYGMQDHDYMIIARRDAFSGDFAEISSLFVKSITTLNKKLSKV